MSSPATSSFRVNEPFGLRIVGRVVASKLGMIVQAVLKPVGILLFVATMAVPSSVAGPYLMENLGRGLVAFRTSPMDVYIGWRLLGTDAPETAFNLYRSTGGGTPAKLNGFPLTTTTDYVDTGAPATSSYAYHVRPVVDGAELDPSRSFTIPALGLPAQFLEVPLQVPPGGTVMGQNYSYSANDASVADLDGDGEYEIVLKWEPSNSKRPPQTGFTGPHILDGYKLDGTHLWRINLGINIRAGAAFTQFLVYDLDGDGFAEIVCKTADGTVDGMGFVIGDPTADWRRQQPEYSSSDPTYGKILDGPEYLTVFDGLTGAALATVPYVPDRYPIDGWGGPGGNGNNDSTGNRVDHFSAGVAYLDGERPSVVMVRGWYGRSVLAAWDWRDGELSLRWVFDSAQPPWVNHPVTYPYAPEHLEELSTFSAQGNHSLTVGDFDGDGRHEVCIGAMTVDDDGTGLYSTGLRHGDALHAGDLDPARPGLEVFGIHENEGRTVSFQTPGSAMFDAATGEVLWGNNPGVDVARGMAADIDPNYFGAECWGAPGGTRRVDTGEVIYSQTPNSTNHAVWWDGDLLRELLDGTTISKWNWTTRSTTTLLSPPGISSNNGTKANPCLTADLFGDWREEVIWRTSDNSALRIYSTTIPATNRFFTLMHDPQYRLAIAWQNVAYNQPPHPSFFLGHGMVDPPPPDIITRLENAAPVVDVGPDASLNEGEAFTRVGSFTDDSSEWTATVDYGDGSGVQPLALNPDKTFDLIHTYGDNGSNTITVTVTDDEGAAGTDDAIVTVYNVAPDVDPPMVSPEPSIKGGSAMAGAGFSDPGANDTPFTWTVDYGDGSGEQPGEVDGDIGVGPEHVYEDVGSYTVTVTVTDKDGASGINTGTHEVIYEFTGFFQPVENPPVVNVMGAGRAVQLKFSLGGYQGLDVLAPGYPQSQQVSCDLGLPMFEVEETVTAGSSSLSYDAAKDRYVYVWKTDKTWSDTCRLLVMKLNDGREYRANFKFK